MNEDYEHNFALTKKHVELPAMIVLTYKSTKNTQNSLNFLGKFTLKIF